MKVIALAAILCFSTKCMCQQSIIKDINKDSYPDTIIVESETGTSNSITIMTIVDCKTKTRVVISKNYSFSSFLSVTPIPAEFKTLNIDPSAVDDILYSNQIVKTSDPALNWLLNAKKIKQDDANFDMLIQYRVKWNSQSEFRKRDYHLILKSRCLDSSFSERFNQKLDETVWVEYYGHNHQYDSVLLTSNDKKTVVHGTAHGVYVKSGGKCSWAFIADSYITSAHDKLRWPSIKKVLLNNNTLYLLQEDVTADVNYLYVIDFRKGTIKRIYNTNIGIESVEDFYIQGGKVIILSGTHKIIL